MEIAGWQVARWVFAIAAGRRDPILVVAGHGNNGGDGLVAARHLLTWGLPVRVALVAEPERLGELLTPPPRRAPQPWVRRSTEHPDGDLPPELVGAAGIVIDALLGTGVRGDPRPPQARAIALLPAGRTFAIDVPSGLDATTGSTGDTDRPRTPHLHPHGHEGGALDPGGPPPRR